MFFIYLVLDLMISAHRESEFKKYMKEKMPELTASEINKKVANATMITEIVNSDQVALKEQPMSLLTDNSAVKILKTNNAENLNIQDKQE